MLSLLQLNIVFTPQSEAYTIKEWLCLDSVMSERFVAVRHSYTTQQLQNERLLTKGKVAHRLPFACLQKSLCSLASLQGYGWFCAMPVTVASHTQTLSAAPDVLPRPWAPIGKPACPYVRACKASNLPPARQLCRSLFYICPKPVLTCILPALPRPVEGKGRDGVTRTAAGLPFQSTDKSET